MQAYQLDYQYPLDYVLLKLEKYAPWRMRPLAQPQISSKDSKTAAFLSVPVPLILYKNSYKPEVTDYNLMGPE